MEIFALLPKAVVPSPTSEEEVIVDGAFAEIFAVEESELAQAPVTSLEKAEELEPMVAPIMASEAVPIWPIALLQGQVALPSLTAEVEPAKAEAPVPPVEDVVSSEIGFQVAAPVLPAEVSPTTLSDLVLQETSEPEPMPTPTPPVAAEQMPHIVEKTAASPIIAASLPMAEIAVRSVIEPQKERLSEKPASQPLSALVPQAEEAVAQLPEIKTEAAAEAEASSLRHGATEVPKAASRSDQSISQPLSSAPALSEGPTLPSPPPSMEGALGVVPGEGVKIAASPAEAARPNLPPPPVAQQIAVAIQKADGKGVELVLQPEELGGLRITMRQDGDVMRVHLIAERGETLDMLRRSISELSQELRDAGHSATSFSFSGDGAPSRRSNPAMMAALGQIFALEESEPSPATQSGKRLDLRL